MQPFTYISIFGYKLEAALKVILSKLKVSVCSLLRDTLESDFAFLRVNFLWDAMFEALFHRITFSYLLVLLSLVIPN